MHYTGTIWRPPYEAYSMLIQVTAGCTHHSCKFCTLYEDLPFKFRLSPIEEVKSDLKEASYYYRHAQRVFFTGANPFVLSVNKLKTLIKNLTIQCVRLKEEVIQLRKEKKRLSDDVEFYKGKIKDMSDRTELLQEKADDLERVKRYAGAEQIDTIIRKVKEQERTEQQIRRYDRSYGTR